MPSTQFRRCGLVAIIVVALVATGGIAYASIPDAGGVIHSCYTKSSGAWRIVDSEAGQTCKSNEAALDLYSKGAADLAFLTKTGKAADSDKLDGQDSSAFLGSGAKAADSDKLDGQDSSAFLGANASAADSDRLGGFAASRYILGGGVQVMDGGILADGGTSSLTCCEELGMSPPMTVVLHCDTSGNTTLVASSPSSFHWWWDGTFGNATPVGSGFEAELDVPNGVARNSLRATAGGISLTYDLDTFIGATCTFGWTWAQTFHTNPGP